MIKFLGWPDELKIIRNQEAKSRTLSRIESWIWNFLITQKFLTVFEHLVTLNLTLKETTLILLRDTVSDINALSNFLLTVKWRWKYYDEKWKAEKFRFYMRDMFENLSNISKDDEDEEKPFDLLNKNFHKFLWIWKYKRMRRIFINLSFRLLHFNF